GVPPSGSRAAAPASRGAPPSALIPPAPHPGGSARSACPDIASLVGGLAVFPHPTTAFSPHRAAPAPHPCVLRPSSTPDGLRCAVLATVPGNSARATGARHEREVLRFAGAQLVRGVRCRVRYRQPAVRQAFAREHGTPYDDGMGPVRGAPPAVRR